VTVNQAAADGRGCPPAGSLIQAGSRALLLCATIVGVPLGCATTSAPEAARGRAVAQPGIYRFSPATTRPQTRAERSGFTETSNMADVRVFLDSLVAMGGEMTILPFGTSAEGREIPMVVASRPRIRSATEARVMNRPIIYIQGNIHGGEVEGKEALQALLRRLALEREWNILDEAILLVVPVYNPDGNERLGPQERLRPSQHGPAMIGSRPNGDTLDLNRDYIKAEAPETRATLRMLQEWDPDIFIDLHTTNGSFHGYSVTYSPPLNPASFITGAYTRDTILPAVRYRMRNDYLMETFDYGNFAAEDSVELGWFTYDHRPRYGTNYMGLRGRIAVLVEAYSRDPFQRRVASTYAFVYELIHMLNRNRVDILASSAEADRRPVGWGTQPGSGPAVPVRSALRVPSRREAVRVEITERTGDSVRTEPGTPPGVRRTGQFRTPVIPIYDRFTPLVTRSMPHAYVLPPEARAAAELLSRHGIIVETAMAQLEARGERFLIDSIIRDARAYQGHHETRLAGRWEEASVSAPPGSFVIRTGQTLAVLAVYMLEPESDDGLVTWNLLDEGMASGTFPVVRILQTITTPLREITF
jgi:hypothetical protein